MLNNGEWKAGKAWECTFEGDSVLNGIQALSRGDNVLSYLRVYVLYLAATELPQKLNELLWKAWKQYLHCFAAENDSKIVDFYWLRFPHVKLGDLFFFFFFHCNINDFTLKCIEIIITYVCIALQNHSVPVASRFSCSSSQFMTWGTKKENLSLHLSIMWD